MKTYLLLFPLYIFISCSSETQRPIDLIEKDKMVGILVDIHLAEASVSVKNLPQDSSKKLFDAFQMAIFTTHSTDSSKFRKSYRYYLTKDVKKMDEIYASVVDTLGSWEARKKLE